MNRSIACFSVFLLLLQLSTVSNAADTTATNGSPRKENGIVYSLGDLATEAFLAPHLDGRRLERDRSDYLEERHRFSTFRDFERDRYRRKLRQSYMGMAVGLHLTAIGTTVAIVATILIISDMKACEDEPEDDSSCSEEQGFLSEVVSCSFYPSAALLIVPGIVIASIYGTRVKRTKKVLEELGWNSSNAVSLKSIGPFPVRGGAGIGASFSF